MTRVKDVCRHLRSKAAGPFWVTIDLFFDGPESFVKYSNCEALSAERIGSLYGVDPKMIKRFAIADLNVVKISYPRSAPQGGVVERDLHCGQQYVRLLDVEVE